MEEDKDGVASSDHTQLPSTDERRCVGGGRDVGESALLTAHQAGRDNDGAAERYGMAGRSESC